MAPKLVAKKFANQWVSIQMPTILRIFVREQFCSSQLAENPAPFGLAQFVNDLVRPGIAAALAEPQGPFRQRADQTNLICEVPTAQDPRQANSDKIP